MDDVLPASSVAWTHSTKVECSRWPITLDRSPGAVLMIAQYAVQIECGADQCKMSEGLRKIAQSLSLRTDLFCVKPEMIRITQHSLKHKPGLVELFRDSLTRSRKRLHKPERAHVESALLTEGRVSSIHACAPAMLLSLNCCGDAALSRQRSRVQVSSFPPAFSTTLAAATNDGAELEGEEREGTFMPLFPPGTLEQLNR